MEPIIRRFNEYIMVGQHVTANIAGAGFKLMRGVADVEFLQNLKTIGIAEGMRPGDAVTDLPFDRVKVTNVTGLNTDFEFYVMSGKYQSDRVMDRVPVYQDTSYLKRKKGGKAGFSLTNPTATERATMAFRCPQSRGNHPYVISRSMFIDQIYVSAPCRVWVVLNIDALYPAPFSVLVARQGGIAPVTAGNAVTGYAEWAEGEKAPGAPPGAIFVNGLYRFASPFLLQRSQDLIIQAVEAGALNVNIEWLDEDAGVEW